MNTINYGDPEPDRRAHLEDKHGDVWSWDGWKRKWTTPETAWFHWHEMRKSWFPMKETES